MNITRPIVFSALSVAVAVMAGCGGTAPRGAVGTPAASASVAPSELPAIQGAHTWPDGFSIRVVSLARVDMAEVHSVDPNMYALPEGTTLVKLTVSMRNDGTSPVDLSENRSLWQLLTGVNRLDAQGAGGDQFSGPLLTSERPERVAPGQTVQSFDSWSVPTPDLSVVAVRVDMGGSREPFTFTDVNLAA